jgi:FMN phosphatase YigB (HAD superfamily)
MIKAIIFDFFGVLVSEGFKQFRDDHFPGDKQKWAKAIELVNRHDSGLISREEFIAGMAQISGKSYDFVAQGINQNQPNDTLISYIKKELKPKYKVGLLSNSGDDYPGQMLDPKDIELFDDIILSYRHRMIKPQLEIFELAAERLGVLTTECVFIDDSPSHCNGARQAGMKAICYEDFPSFKKELEQLIATGSDN